MSSKSNGVPGDGLEFAQPSNGVVSMYQCHYCGSRNNVDAWFDPRSKTHALLCEGCARVAGATERSADRMARLYPDAQKGPDPHDGEPGPES